MHPGPKLRSASRSWSSRANVWSSSSSFRSCRRSAARASSSSGALVTSCTASAAAGRSSSLPESRVHTSLTSSQASAPSSASCLLCRLLAHLRKEWQERCKDLHKLACDCCHVHVEPPHNSTRLSTMMPFSWAKRKAILRTSKRCETVVVLFARCRNGSCRLSSWPIAAVGTAAYPGVRQRRERPEPFPGGRAARRAQHHARRLAGELSAEQVAGYSAKYATKATESFGAGLDRRSGVDDLEHLDSLPVHVAELVRAAWELGGRPELEGLRLRAWAHMLGFRATGRPRAAATRRSWASCGGPGSSSPSPAGPATPSPWTPGAARG